MLAPRTWLFPDYNQAESRVVAWKGPVPQLKQWYSEGVDVHTLVCQRIAKALQTMKMPMPTSYGRELFKWKHYEEFGRGDEEREQTKRIVHGSNYGEGIAKLALIIGVDEKTATILHKIYHSLFPEVKINYQAGIEREIRKSKTLWKQDRCFILEITNM